MAFVITARCIGVKDAACVSVCPVDCIQGGPEDPQLYIDPEDCIDCAACEPVCPVDAIFIEDDVPPEYTTDIERNRAFFEPEPR